MDSKDRENIIRQWVERVKFNPSDTQYEVSVHELLTAWQADAQDVHERSYQDGAEGVMA